MLVSSSDMPLVQDELREALSWTFKESSDPRDSIWCVEESVIGEYGLEQTTFGRSSFDPRYYRCDGTTLRGDLTKAILRRLESIETKENSRRDGDHMHRSVRRGTAGETEERFQTMRDSVHWEDYVDQEAPPGYRPPPPPPPYTRYPSSPHVRIQLSRPDWHPQSSRQGRDLPLHRRSSQRSHISSRPEGSSREAPRGGGTYRQEPPFRQQPADWYGTLPNSSRQETHTARPRSTPVTRDYYRPPPPQRPPPRRRSLYGMSLDGPSVLPFGQTSSGHLSQGQRRIADWVLHKSCGCPDAMRCHPRCPHYVPIAGARQDTLVARDHHDSGDSRRKSNCRRGSHRDDARARNQRGRR